MTTAPNSQSSTTFVYDNYTLFISQTAYDLVGKSTPTGAAETLHVDRLTGEFSVASGAKPRPETTDQEITVYGLFGVIKLYKSTYMIFVSKREKVGTILGTDVYKAMGFSVYPIERIPARTLLNAPDESYLLELLRSHLLSSPYFFQYSGSYVVGSSLQRQEAMTRPPTAALWQIVDDRFFWNRHLLNPIIDLINYNQDTSRFALPAFFGFFETVTQTFNGRPVLFALISRRSRFRAGTRYFSRGVDMNGNVSNYNETEQILLVDESYTGADVKGDLRFSYVQIRGSVPVYWAEINNLRYKPDLKIMDIPNTIPSAQKHFSNQVSLYGDVYVVNLVNQKGYEKPVKEAYESVLADLNNPRVHYTYFDFHHECKGLHFENVSKLIHTLENPLIDQGYFVQSAQNLSKPLRKQKSVVRTNCMDSLDRTNVVQSSIAKWVLTNQLRQSGAWSENESFDDHRTFLFAFQNAWADNADWISTAYSGTGALKTDFTRTGKRSTQGAIQDGVNSLVRYVKNNYLDGRRQDAYDLVTGRWTIDVSDRKALFRDQRPVLTKVMPYIGLAALFIVFIHFLTPSHVSTQARALFGIALITVFFSLYYIVANGVDYVSWPRLLSSVPVITYSGKGYVSGHHGLPKRFRVSPVAVVNEKSKSHAE